jgi:tRNA-dihydrouridine synthase
MLVQEQVAGALGKMKKFASWFTRGVRNGSELRKQVQSAQDVREVTERVDEFFEALSIEADGSTEPMAWQTS